MTHSLDIKAFALKYVERKIRVFPLRPHGKEPITPKGFKDATLDLRKVEEWWDQTPSANIGVPTGVVSEFIVLDVDPRHGGDDSLEKLETEIGKLPVTQTVLTGGGGLHLYFQHPGWRIGNRAGVLPGLDVRGDGGYVVGAGSVHENGKAYVWEVSSSPDEVPLASMPHDLLRLVSGDCASSSGFTPKTKDWIARAIAGAKDGTRNHTITSLCGHLLRHYVDPHVVLSLLLSFNCVQCHPSLPDEDVVGIVERIATRERRRRKEAI